MAKRTHDAPEELCPCNRGRPYATCCGPLHAGAPAADAEALMRSRYAAYARHDAAYLLATWHPEFRPSRIEFDPSMKWIGLDILRHEQIDETHAVVEFVARFKVGGRAGRMREASRFLRVDGRWLYCDGDQAAA